MRLGPVLQIFGWKAVFDQLAVALLIADDDRPRVRFDDLALDSEVLDEDVIAAS